MRVLLDVLRGYLSIESARAFVASIQEVAEDHPDPEVVEVATRDPKDLVALAKAAQVDALVSGDDDLAAVDLAARVMSPAALLRALSD